MTNIKCARCGAVILEKHHLIQHMEYMGQSSPRLDICDTCNESFKYWLALCSIHDMYPIGFIKESTNGES